MNRFILRNKDKVRKVAQKRPGLRIQSKDPDEEIRIKCIISIGLDLMDILKLSNKTMSSIIFNSYLTCILLASTQLYVLFYSLYSSIYWLASGNFLLALLSFLRLYNISNSGEVLRSCVIKARFELEKYKSENVQRNQPKTKFLIKLLDRASDSPIQPYSFFNLGHTNLAKTVATVAGYLTLLLRFKVGPSTMQTSATITHQNWNGTLHHII